MCGLTFWAAACLGQDEEAGDAAQGTGSSDGSGGAATMGGGSDGMMTSLTGSPSTSLTTASTLTTSPGDSSGDGSDSSSGTGMLGPCEGLGNAGLVLHTTLDDAASIAGPAVGAGAGEFSTAPADDFQPGQSGDGIQLDADGEYVRYPQAVGGTNNIDLSQGTVDFCYLPAYDHLDGVDHAIFGTDPFNTGGFRVRKAGGSNTNHFQIIVLDGGGNLKEYNIPPDAYVLLPGQWTRVTFSWDFSLGAGQQMRFYLDGVEIAGTYYNADVPTNMPAPSPSGFVYIGSFGVDSWSATGIVDDFKLYDSALVP